MSDKKVEKRNIGILTVFLLVTVVLLVFAFFIMLIMYLISSTQDRDISDIFIYDADGSEWGDDVELEVFYNEEFGSNTVAPYSKGVYKFMFQNSTEYTLQYQIVLAEENEYDIALCYKLKRDGAYLVDSYTRTDDFKCSGITIEANSTHYFELEWYWDGDVSDVNDTLAGLNSSIYTLELSINAKAVS